MSFPRRSSSVLAASAALLVVTFDLSCSGGDTVTETPATVARLDLTAPKTAIAVGESVQLTATPYSDRGNPLGARPVTFQSSRPDVLEVNGSGLAHGVSKGSATITASAGAVTNSLDFTVSLRPAVALSPANVSFAAVAGGTDPPSQAVQVTNGGDGTLSGLAAQVSYGAGQPQGWLSAQLAGTNAPTTLTLRATAGGLSPGQYQATASISGTGATAAAVGVTLTVSPPPVASVRVQPDTATLDVGQSRTFRALTLDAAGNVLTGRVVNWTSPDTAVMSLSAAQGDSVIVTGRGAGSATITATSEGKAGSAAVLVPSHTLAVTGSGAGTGTVTSTPAGISCAIAAGAGSGSCRASFASGTSVTLAAAGTGGSTFSGFSGGCTGTTCAIRLTQDSAVTAAFTAPVTSYTISTSSNPTAGGSTSGGGTYTSGSSVTVLATPAAGYGFVNWTEGGTVVSTAASYTFTATANRTLVANFGLIQTLTVAGSGTGSGTVTSTPAGISCAITAGVAGGTCQAGFASGTSVSLAASGTGGSTFSGFSGACTGTTCSLTLTQNSTVTAAFTAPVTYTITTSSNPAGGGTTSGGGTYKPDSSVTVLATPAAGYAFVNWTEGGTVVSTAASYTFTATANRTLVANFGLIRTLTVAGSGTGSGTVTSTPAGISCTITAGVAGGTCQAGFASGTSVSLDASGTGGSTFSGFSGGCTGTTCAITLTQNSTVTAAFTASVTYTITTSSNPVGGGTTSGGGTYKADSSVTVLATPASGYAFVNWTEGGTPVSTAASYTFTVTANRTLVANFVLADTLSLGLSGSGAGTVKVNGTAHHYAGSPQTLSLLYPPNTTLALQAQPDSGFYYFAGWSGACSGLGSTCGFTLTRDTAVGASFARATLTLATPVPDTVCNRTNNCALPVTTTLTATAKGVTAGTMVFSSSTGQQLSTSTCTLGAASGIPLYTCSVVLDATGVAAGPYTIQASMASGSDALQSNIVPLQVVSKG